ncbi:cyclic di-GMP phosphodiesterase response regulator RpfG [mine drainage metagenome]|uniref:Cyclic di-GMP phosphodiesterase response regulator RpfG n=1 Tax=mine drainage metagenome TaxID=410659 RepID=A0A1J5RRX6_9ZZZZ
MKLRFKLPLVYTLLIAALGAAFVVFTSRLVEQRMVEEEHEYFGSLAKTLAMNTANAISLRDYAALREFVDNMAHGEHVRYAVILDDGGVVFAHSRHELEGKLLDDPVSRASAAAEELLMQPDGTDTLDVTAPLHIAGRKWGAVRIGYSLTEMQQKVAQARNLVLLAGLIATLMGTAVAIFIARRITAPLHALHRGTEIIGAGDLNYRLAVSADDEIGQLAAAFNTMTGHLRKNYQAIERAKHEWETSLDAVSDPLFIHDQEFKILRCNRAYVQAAGISFQEIIGKPYYEVFPKSDGPTEGCSKALERQEDGEEEIFVPAVDRIFNAKFYLVRNVDGAYLYSLHILKDITESKRAEEKLRNSEASLAKAQQIAHLGSWDWNMATGELFWSDEIYRIFGLAPHEFGATYEAFLNFVHSEDREFVTQSVNAALVEQKSYSINHRIVLPDGSERFVHEEAEVIRDREGKPTQMSGIVHDITEWKKAEEELHELFLAAMQSLASAIEAKSPWTRGHSERVADYAVKIGQSLELTDDELEKLRIAALLHDIGKIGTYDGILDKHGKLTDAEYESIKQHPGRGAEMLAPIKQLRDIIPWVRGHHERFDGAGYPDGLRGEDIPLQARILAVADTFDSMTAVRPYRTTPGKAQALEEIHLHSGTQFDPKVVEAFLRTEPLAAPTLNGNNHVTEAIHGQVVS